jgi:hypothetical protein
MLWYVQEGWKMLRFTFPSALTKTSSRKEGKVILAKNSHSEASVANQGYRSQGPTNY